MRENERPTAALEWCETARAKINLYLAVGARRDDGYHPVATVIQPLELADALHIRLLKGRRPGDELAIRVAAAESEAPSGPDNLAWRAVKLLEPRLIAAVPELCSVEVEIVKRIPVAAGLGGGSADAAAVLGGLNRRLGLGLSQRELEAFGATLGSDVPACLAGRSVLCTGRGEQVQPVEARPMWCVLAKPDGALSTGAVYAEFDKVHPGGAARDLAVPAGLLEALRRGDPSALAPYLRNDLQDVAAQLHPGVLPLLRELSQGGAVAALLSGSGPTLFGLVESEAAARGLARRMSEVAAWVWWGLTFA